MRAEWIERWATLLVDYCLEVSRGESILIQAEFPAHDLVSACCRSVIDRGGDPIPRLQPAGVPSYFLEHADETVLARLEPTGLFDATATDARILIRSSENLRSALLVDPDRHSQYTRARQPVSQAIRRKKNVITQYPTRSFAEEAKMVLDEYETFIARALFIDRPDPASSWKDLGSRQQVLVESMSQVQNLRFVGLGTDLSMEVGGRTWINSDGKRNMPSGEIFTGPIETSVEGTLHCRFPTFRDGHEISQIRLRFESGQVVESSAEVGQEYLDRMIEMDEGSRRLGEVGLGLNPGIDRFTGSILFDEKIGGTAHFALGQSYPETGGVNRSGLHWDLIVDLREQGRIYADGVLVMEDGVWKVGL